MHIGKWKEYIEKSIITSKYSQSIQQVFKPSGTQWNKRWIDRLIKGTSQKMDNVINVQKNLSFLQVTYAGSQGGLWPSSRILLNTG
jgi:hypothetical protein